MKKLTFYIYTHPTARGLKLGLMLEGALIFTATVWKWDFTFYRGPRFVWPAAKEEKK